MAIILSEAGGGGGRGHLLSAKLGLKWSMKMTTSQRYMEQDSLTNFLMPEVISITVIFI